MTTLEQGGFSLSDASAITGLTSAAILRLSRSGVVSPCVKCCTESVVFDPRYTTADIRTLLQVALATDESLCCAKPLVPSL